jgi:hypothetical protein
MVQDHVSTRDEPGEWRGSRLTRRGPRARAYPGHSRHERADVRRVPLGVIIIVGGLIYFPMLILGPIGERIIG